MVRGQYKRLFCMYARIISLKKILSEIDVDIWKRNFHIEQSEKSNMSLIQIRTLMSIQHMKLLLIG